MTAHDIAAIIEAAAPLHTQEPWDNTGLQIGNDNADITGILLCVDVTEAVVNEAEEKGCNMIISHHPMIFSGLKSICGDNYISRCTAMLIKKGIALYACHTSIDKAPEGISHAMCVRLGLQDLHILDPDGDNCGLGMYGTLPAPVNETDFLITAKKVFKTAIVRHSALTGRKISKVAVCGGSGGPLIERAMETGADAFVSADIKYHDFFKPEGRMLIADVGHYESEQFAKDIFFDLLSKKIDTFAIHFSDRDTNPVFCL